MPQDRKKATPKPQTNIDSITKKHIGKKGLKIDRYFTKAGINPLDQVDYDYRTSKITNTNGETVFEMKNVEVPKSWSQVATDVLAQKYFRKKGVPQYDAKGKLKKDKNGKVVTGSESSIRQVVYRLAGTWRHWGEKNGYFNSKKDADAYQDEMSHLLVNQMSAPNSPQWFNTGLNFAYGISGEPQGHYYVDPQDEELKKSTDAYTRPQPHACFIQSVKDDMVNEGGIFDLVLREALLFKYGSGTGSNFSNIRGKNETLSGGGSSSGLMSFLSIFDKSAGSIKSGGTTRRAAKMVCLDMDHPEIEDFINWKVIEEQKVAALNAGSHVCHKHLTKILKSANENGLNPKENTELKQLIWEAMKLSIPQNYIKRILMLSEQGVAAEDFDFRTYDTDFRSEAYSTVGGQNSNNSIRLTKEFITAVEEDGKWDLINRTDGSVYKTVQARDLWEDIAFAAWACADPGIQMDTTINEWHTCPENGRINASNPCSEYMFLDDTACNLASLNLIKFYDADTKKIDVKGIKHACRLWTITLEISVLMAQFPSKAIAQLSYDFRTLGLGYANIGTLLMQQGIPYDSPEGSAICGAITAIMCGEAYATSAEMAKTLKPFSYYEQNKEHMLRVIRNHRLASYNAEKSEYEELTVTPQAIHPEFCPDELLIHARECWDRALALGEAYGYRNAQTTVIAPTGTIGLVMDCDTTGIEPDFALVKFKKLVGGGYFKIANQSIPVALENLGYNEEEITDIIDYSKGKGTLKGCPHINHESLSDLGFGDKEIEAIEAQLLSAFELKYAFNKWSLGEEFCTLVLGFTPEQLNSPDFNMLSSLGFSDTEIEEANEYVCGTMTVEGAPHLKEEHYAVFDCANKCGKKGKRFIAPKGHLRMMAAAQPFISGAISKTINMPEEATIEEVKDMYMESWNLMIKANALYRDGSKLSQPLTTSSSDDYYSQLFNVEEMDMADDAVGPQEVQKVIEKIVQKPLRRKLPTERHSVTHKFSIANHEGYITVGLYEDGQPGEIFIKMSKEGSTLSGIMDALALSVSLNLQYGVPLEVLVNKFTHTRFEPAGMTKNKEIPMVKSIIDYIGRWLAVRFLEKDTAKKYHSGDLVDQSHESGTIARMPLPKLVAQQVKEIREKIAMEEKSVEVSETKSVTMKKTDTKLDIEFKDKMMVKAAAQLNNSDAPCCGCCGSVMVRNGSCYKCNDCGETSGCS